VVAEFLFDAAGFSLIQQGWSQVIKADPMLLSWQFHLSTPPASYFDYLVALAGQLHQGIEGCMGGAKTTQQF
jgi:hypothetical protein